MKKIMAIILLLTIQKIYAEKILVEKNDLVKLYEISKEYMELSKQDKIDLSFEKLTESKIKFILTLKKNLKYSNDFIFSTEVDFDKKITKIAFDSNNNLVIEFEESKKFWFNNFITGFLSSSALFICIILLI